MTKTSENKTTQKIENNSLSMARQARRDRVRKNQVEKKLFTPALIVTQVKSAIRRPEIQSRHLRGLGLGKIGRAKRLEDTPAIRGMIDKIKHLITVQYIK